MPVLTVLIFWKLLILVANIMPKILPVANLQHVLTFKRLFREKVSVK